MQNILSKLFDNFDYDSYLALKESKSYFILSSVITVATGFVNDSISWLLLSYILFGGIVFLDSKCLFLNVREVNEIQKKYQEFLEKYSEFVKTFELTNPMEVMFLFSFLLKNGYLSENHIYKYSHDTLDYPNIAGAQCFTGNLGGSNSAKLLTDILNYEGYDASILLGYKDIILGDNLKTIIAEAASLNVKEFLSQASNKEIEQLRLNMEAMIRDGIIKLEDFHLPEIPWLYLNHGVTVTKFNDKNYYLDPIFEAVYKSRMIDNRRALVSGLDVFVPHTTNSYSIPYKDMGENAKKVRSMLNGLEASLEEERQARKKIEQITTDNRDIMEHFYRENASLYGDVSRNLKRMRLKDKNVR